MYRRRPPNGADAGRGRASTRRISASAARPTSSWRLVGSRVPTRAGARSRARSARASARPVVALAPGEDLDGDAAVRRARRRRRPAASGARAPGAAAACPARLEAIIGAIRCEPQRSCSLAASRGVVVVLLVGGDRLVLDAVVLGELAAAQREQRRGERERRRAPPRRRRRARGGAAARRRAWRRPSTPSTAASWNGSRASGSAALDERDDGHRLGRGAATPRTPGTPSARAGAACGRRRP